MVVLAAAQGGSSITVRINGSNLLANPIVDFQFHPIVNHKMLKYMFVLQSVILYAPKKEFFILHSCTK